MCSALPTPPCPATLLPQINKEALRAQTNSTGYTTFERLIPVEAMFIVSGKSAAVLALAARGGRWHGRPCARNALSGDFTPGAAVIHCGASLHKKETQAWASLPCTSCADLQLRHEQQLHICGLRPPAVPCPVQGGGSRLGLLMCPVCCFEGRLADLQHMAGGRVGCVFVSSPHRLTTCGCTRTRRPLTLAAPRLTCPPSSTLPGGWLGLSLRGLAGTQAQAVDWHARQGEHATLVFAACSRSTECLSELTHMSPLLTPRLCLSSCAATATHMSSPPTTRRWCRSPATACPGTLAGLGPFARSKRACH